MDSMQEWRKDARDENAEMDCRHISENETMLWRCKSGGCRDRDMKATFLYALPGDDKGHDWGWGDMQVTEGVEDTTEMVDVELGGDSL